MRLPLLALSLLLAGAGFAHAAESLRIDVKQSGAVGDGVADDTAALQKALDGGRRTVTIPAGTYRISAALLADSNTSIQADPHAVIRLADHAGTSVDVFLLTNRDRVQGNHDISVEGGIWDGNNEQNPRGDLKREPCYTGVALNFIHVQHLTLRGLTVRNPDSYSIRGCYLSDFVIEDIGFDDSSVRRNQDGVHLNGFCERGVIRNISALSPYATNDDMVALNADDGTDAVAVTQQGMVTGPIRDIQIEHLRGESVFTFVRLLSRDQPIENVTIRDVEGGCRFYAINMDRWRLPAGGGKIKNVTLHDFKVRKVPDNFSQQVKAAERPLIHIQCAVQGLRIENFQRPLDDTPPARTLFLENGVPNDLRLEGLSAQQAEDLQTASPVVQPAMVAPGSDAATRNLHMKAAGDVTLPHGGFTRLELNSE